MDWIRFLNSEEQDQEPGTGTASGYHCRLMAWMTQPPCFYRMFKRFKSRIKYLLPFRSRPSSRLPASNVSDPAAPDAIQPIPRSKTSLASRSQENISSRADLAAGRNAVSLEMGSERYLINLSQIPQSVTPSTQPPVPSLTLAPLSELVRAENQLTVPSVPENQPPNLHVSGSTLTFVEGNMQFFNYTETSTYLKTCIIHTAINLIVFQVVILTYENYFWYVSLALMRGTCQPSARN